MSRTLRVTARRVVVTLGLLVAFAGVGVANAAPADAPMTGTPDAGLVVQPDLPPDALPGR